MAALLGCAAAGCAAGAGDPARIPSPGHDAFQSYWYRGQAELTRYELEQARYGEIHRGDAVLIFVTEDFLPQEQVKYGRPVPGGEPLSVLKLNFTRKFSTGIYPYSIMTSVFTPVAAGARTLKVSSSTQEWCGHTYEQLNLRDGTYRGVLHSYFQEEADREIEIEQAVLEDEIWTRIRLDPGALPLGEIRLIPGLHWARLRHRPSRAERAVAALTAESGGTARVYRIDYPDLSRSLAIRFEAAFPHPIVSWEERDGSAPGDVTRATRTHSIMTDYWNKHSVADGAYRQQLGLDGVPVPDR